MKVGIIGAGNIGGNLTRRLTALGHEVAIANSRGPEILSDLAAETGARAVDVREAAREAEVVIVTIPQKSVPALPAGVLDGAADGAVIVDTGNYTRSSATGGSRPSRRAPPRAGGSRTSSGSPSSRRSTASTPRTCSTPDVRPALLTGGHCRSPATTRPRRTS